MPNGFGTGSFGAGKIGASVTPDVPPATLVDVPDPYPFEVTDWGSRLYEALLPLGYADEAHAWALLKLCNSIGVMYEDLHLLTGEDDEGHPGWSALVDIDRCPPSQLGWLAQLVGVTPIQGLDEDQQRELIRAHPNFITGTRQSFVAAAQQTLTGAQTVGIVERYEDDPDQVLVYTRTAETPDEDATLRALMRVKPIGIKLTYIVTEGVLVEELAGTVDSLTGTIDDLDDL